MLVRVQAISDPARAPDPGYAEALRAAIPFAVDYGLAAVEARTESLPTVPAELFVQARLAARNRVGVDTVLRRYFAGYTLLNDFLVREAAELGMSGATLKGILHAQAAAFDQLLVAVSEEHAREAHPSPTSTGRRRLRLVQGLLAGELVDAAELRYPLEGRHIGLVCLGPEGGEVVNEIVAGVDGLSLVLRPNPDTVWAWLGGTRAMDADRLSGLAVESPPVGTTIAVGELADGLAGWRLTHRQAAAALPIALRRGDPVVRYIDVAVLVAAMRDGLAARALRRFYLRPLEGRRDGGEVARETLRAYFAAERNVSSAAARLGVTRTTAGSRLRAIEAAIGRPLASCAAELEVALRLEEMDA